MHPAIPIYQVLHWLAVHLADMTRLFLPHQNHPICLALLEQYCNVIANNIIMWQLLNHLNYLVYPLTILLYLATTTSNQPHLLLWPVVTPNSLPNFYNLSPISCIILWELMDNTLKLTLSNSVGKAPLPTRVVYALKTPHLGATPSPVHTAPAEQLHSHIWIGSYGNQHTRCITYA